MADLAASEHAALQRARRAGDVAAVEAILRRAVERAPEDAAIRLDHGNALRDLYLYEEALAEYSAILSRDPGNHKARAAAALIFFYAGDWGRAWPAFEVRYRLMDTPPALFRTGPDGKRRPLPAWRGQGEPKRLVVLGEQGKGDTIQFCRYLPDLVRRGIEITLITNESLFALVRTLQCPLTLKSLERPEPLGAFDAWLPLMSLPLALDLRPDRFTPTMPYLTADPDRIALWRARLGTHGYRVGIAWRGNPAHSADADRSMPLVALAPLAGLAGVRLVSLQKGAEAEIAACPFRDRIETLGEAFDNGPDAFVDTAAAMHGLDLVVTVDSAIGHLAGALARPCHIPLMKHGVDWRWGAIGDATPWYPHHRFFRQARHGDWQDPVARLTNAVAAAARTRPMPSPDADGLALTAADRASRLRHLDAELARLLAEKAALEGAGSTRLGVAPPAPSKARPGPGGSGGRRTKRLP